MVRQIFILISKPWAFSLPMTFLQAIMALAIRARFTFDLRDLVSPYTDCSDLTERFGQQVNDSTTVHLESTDTYSVNNLLLVL